MPRTPADATRFTSTGPYASSKFTQFVPNATPRSSTIKVPSSGGAPDGETPQQKIARLREASRRAKLGQNVDNFDRFVNAGRTWADRIHRMAALGLIGATAIGGVIVSISIGDMVLHNRRKKNEWYTEKAAERQENILIAREALARGTATEDQVLLLNQERAAADAEELKKNRRGIFRKAKDWWYSGMADGEDVASNGTVASRSSDFVQDGEASKSITQQLEDAKRRNASENQGLRILNAVEESSRENAVQFGKEVSDRLEDTVGSDKKKSWSDWALRR